MPRSSQPRTQRPPERLAAAVGAVLASLILAFALAGPAGARVNRYHRPHREHPAHRRHRGHRGHRSHLRFQLTPRQYLARAEAGVTQAGQNNAWGDPNFNWYDELLNDTARSPQATIWGVVALWETVDYDAIADPSSANLDLVKHFADKAENYLDPNVTPAPGVTRTTSAYTPYPGSTSDPETFFDDNAWFALAFMDAYRAETRAGNSGLASRYLADAVQGFDFIRNNGWDDAAGGGMFWNTFHVIPAGHGRSGEALGAATDLAARLYQATGNAGYLATAVKYITWANNNLLKRDGSYAESIPDEITMPHDGEGAMIAAFTALCQANAGTVPAPVYAQVPPNKDHGGDFTFRLPDDPTSWCSWAEALAHHTAFGVNPGNGSLDGFFPLSDGPQWDAIYVRGLLTLYAYDHDSSLYQLATNTAQRIMSNAQGANGLYLKDWNGSSTVADADPGDLRTDGSSLSVFAALATVPAP